MGNLLVLTKVLLKNTLSFGSQSVKNKARFMKQVFLIIVFIAAFGPVLASFGYMVAGAYDLLAPVAQEGVLLGLSLSLVSVLVFFLSIFSVVSVFYFSQDIENLFPLPLRPWEILGAKFLVALLYEYLTGLVLLLPVLVIFGVKSGGGVYYYLAALTVFLTLPVIPFVVASALMMIIMGFTGWVKNKDRFRLWAGIFGLFFAVGFNILFQKYAGQGVEGEKLAQLIMEGNNSLLNLTFGIFPQTRLGTYALINPPGTGVIYLLLYVLAAFCALIVFAFLGQALYFKGVMGITETTVKRKRLGGDELEKETALGSVLKAYVLKELRLLFRTPVYFMNCVLMNFLWPVFLIIPFILQPDFGRQVSVFSGFIKNPDSAGYIAAGVFALGAFVTASNGITSTAVSREGENIYVVKYLPVDYKTQIMAKVLSGVILGFTGLVLVILTIGFFLGISVYLLFLFLISGFLGVLFSSLAGMALDLNFPKLHWDNEQKAVKQNLNVMVMILGAVVLSGLILIGVIKLELGLELALGVIIGFAGLLNWFLYRYLVTRGVQLFADLLS